MSLEYQTLLEGGKHWSFITSLGTVLCLEDLQGGANVGMLLYNASCLLERYNAPDTMKCQHTLRLTRGHCLYSDMGRILCSIIEDTVGWHDTIGGTADKSLTARRWGPQSYQQALNNWSQDGRSSFLVEAAKYGLGRRDLAANINWFSKVSTDEDGTIAFAESHSAAGAFVTLRFEMDVLVLLHTCPHPLNIAATYPRRPVRLTFSRARPISENDVCYSSCPENQRGLAQNQFYLRSGGIRGGDLT